MALRIVVGVTGHRALGPGPLFEAAVDAVIDEIERHAAGEAPGPVWLAVLSPLAEGADRLVAELILRRPGAELDVVLPMQEEEYAADFTRVGSREEFEDLLSRAGSVRRLPVSPTRVEAYVAAGRYVVDHCDVLVALWNGQSAEGPGGTADIVGYARAQGRSLYIIDMADARRIVFEASRDPRPG